MYKVRILFENKEVVEYNLGSKKTLRDVNIVVDNIIKTHANIKMLALYKDGKLI